MDEFEQEAPEDVDPSEEQVQPPISSHVQRLKAAVHYAVGEIVSAIKDAPVKQFSKAFIAATTELTFRHFGASEIPTSIYYSCPSYLARMSMFAHRRDGWERSGSVCQAR